MNKQIRRRIAVGALALAASFGVGAGGAALAAQPAPASATRASLLPYYRPTRSDTGNSCTPTNSASSSASKATGIRVVPPTRVHARADSRARAAATCSLV